MQLAALHDVLGRYIRWKPRDLIAVDFALSVYIASFLPWGRNNPWGGLLGAPSSGKTEIISLFEGCPYTVSVSNLTAKALVSGFRDPNNPDNDPSCLARLQGGKVLTVGDFSTVLSKHDKDADIIMADLRAAYDGNYTHASGTVGSTVYRDKFGVLFGCTPALDEWTYRHQSLGSRFLYFRMHGEVTEEERQATLRFTLVGDSGAKKGTASLAKQETAAFVASLVAPLTQNLVTAPSRSDDLPDILASLANTLTQVRTTPDPGGTVTTVEAPHRVALQLASLGDAHVLVHGRKAWTTDDTEFLQKVAYDTLHPSISRMAEVLYEGWSEGKAVYGRDLKAASGLSQTRTSNQIAQWRIAKIIEGLEGGGYRLCNDRVPNLQILLGK